MGEKHESSKGNVLESMEQEKEIILGICWRKYQNSQGNNWGNLREPFNIEILFG